MAAEDVLEEVESVVFGFMTDDVVRKLSVKKITCPAYFDLVGRPVPDGLYDQAMGSLDDNVPCKTCGQRSLHCPGHCGHIDLPLPIYNPLLFKTMLAILRKTCFYCYHFTIRQQKVKQYADLLERIIKGDIIGAGHLNSLVADTPELLPEDIMEGDETTFGSATFSFFEGLMDKRWTTLQYAMMKCVLDDFMRSTSNACKNCEATNPTITSPTFGSVRMDMRDADVIRNIVKGHKLDTDRTDHSGAIVDIIENGEPFVALECPAMGRTPGDATEAHGDSLEFLKQKRLSSCLLLPTEVKTVLGRLWENEGRLCQLLNDCQRNNLYMHGESITHLIFFMEALLVPPNKFRPPTRGLRSVMEHPQSFQLSNVLQANIYLANAFMNKNERPKIISGWMTLQRTVNMIFDSEKGTGKKNNPGVGIRQLLEKKEGLFRQKMMGKRVNFACRSVISPDPYLAVNEIGIPPHFALRLMYPERVTQLNVDKLRRAVINGSNVHPGATHVVDKMATWKLPPFEKHRCTISRKLLSSRGAVTNSIRSPEAEFEGKTVYRHLQDGDIVLVNRQPTLHKPSMMAHIVRVLKGEKTLRMHYANCRTYNADFDGDEMNVHVPQDELSRSEAVNIVNANEQFVGPASGNPVRGLIQDHIVGAALLTMKDTFLTWEEYHQLLCLSCVSPLGAGKYCNKVCTVSLKDDIEPVPPAIWKPKPSWTGKQVITTILNHVSRGRPPLTTKKDGKIPGEYFRGSGGEKKAKSTVNSTAKMFLAKLSDASREKQLLIWKNELVHGVIDKAQFDKHGLVHAVQQFYGSDTAGLLFSLFSRLLTAFLQMHGFTCGVDDLLITRASDPKRRKALQESNAISMRIHSKFVGHEDGNLDPLILQGKIEKMVHTDEATATACLDRMMINALNQLTTDCNKKLLIEDLFKPFPKNCVSLMTTTGAKGSSVNFSQISSHLGQQELEGSRVPRMISGKTLPCFPPWDCTARAGGFISDRFLTGLRPQEYYFHCMAGRDGLIDTAIKTSRSGYLQRCLIKSLESLKVCYDLTVRDADGSVVQFSYGEDGVDVQKASYLSEFEMLAFNQAVLIKKFSLYKNCADYLVQLPDKIRDRGKDFFFSLTDQKKQTLRVKNVEEFLELIKLKYMSSLAEPGEAVGVIAAQSVGEPSTQMTLNTFHLAGKGEMNVTLGIPRLQEILMRASRSIRTPFMECPLRKGKTRDDAERLAAQLKKVTVADIIEFMEVCVLPLTINKKQVCTVYKLKARLYSPELYPLHSNITAEDCYRTLKHIFVETLEDAINRHLATIGKINDIRDISNNVASMSTSATAKMESNDGSEGKVDIDDRDNSETDGEDGVDAEKRRRQTNDDMDYEDDMKDENSKFDPEGGEAPLFESESDIDHSEADVDNMLGGGTEKDFGSEEIFDIKDEIRGVPPQAKVLSNSKLLKQEKAIKPAGSERNRKLPKRRIFVDAVGLDFEVHFKLENEPRILLAEIAHHAARNVYVKSAGQIEGCSVVDPSPVGNTSSSTLQLRTVGVDFEAFWAMQDHLDINMVRSNDINAILHTYGVEAARDTIVMEIRKVFGQYGVSVDIRHLTLIADYMTAGGGYEPLSRLGIENTISPFSRMTFETATHFLVEAALHGEMEKLESPSARICLGLPVKVLKVRGHQNGDHLCECEVRPLQGAKGLGSGNIHE